MGVNRVPQAARGPFRLRGRVEQKRQTIQRVHVIFTFSANIALPGGEIGNRNHQAPNEGEMGDRPPAHLPDMTSAARYDCGCWMMRFQLMAMSVRSD